MITKVFTSYFYQVRYFPPEMLPISTAAWDPKWYHMNGDQNIKFFSPDGTLIGCRAEILHPDDTCYNLCRGRNNCNPPHPEDCEFLKAYAKQLDKIDFVEFMQALEEYLAEKQKVVMTDFIIPIFIVIEAADNPCSERVVIQNWFKNHGILCEELPYPIQDNLDKIYDKRTKINFN